MNKFISSFTFPYISWNFILEYGMYYRILVNYNVNCKSDYVLRTLFPLKHVSWELDVTRFA